MDQESDEWLEEKDEQMEHRVQSSSSSEGEDGSEETEVTFRATRAGDSSNILHFTGHSSWRQPISCFLYSCSTF
jgi:hypothetical protein